MPVINPDDWMTPEMIRAENDLEDASWEARREVERADELIYEIEKDDVPITDEEVESFKLFALGPNSTPLWKIVQTHVNRGDFTWRQIVEGKVNDDPDVRDALASLVEMRMSVPQLPPGEEARRSPTLEEKKDPISDDEYFDDSNYFNK